MHWVSGSMECVEFQGLPEMDYFRVRSVLRILDWSRHVTQREVDAVT